MPSARSGGIDARLIHHIAAHVGDLLVVIFDERGFQRRVSRPMCMVHTPWTRRPRSTSVPRVRDSSRHRGRTVSGIELIDHRGDVLPRDRERMGMHFDGHAIGFHQDVVGVAVDVAVVGLEGR